MGVVLFILASALVGGRLMLLYARHRQPPELYLGLGYLWAGTLGWGGMLVGTLTTPQHQTVAEGYQAWSVIAGDIGTYCFYLFVWYVFRRNSGVAKLALLVVALVLLNALVRDTWLRGVTFGPPPGSITTLSAAVARGLVFAWMATEAFAAYWALKKRARIGLGNPVVANRLLLWGISAVMSLCISFVAVGLYVTAVDTADATLRQNEAGGVYGALGAVSSIALWFAFFPPGFYRRWLDRGQSSEGTDG